MAWYFSYKYISVCYDLTVSYDGFNTGTCTVYSPSAATEGIISSANVL